MSKYLSGSNFQIVEQVTPGSPADRAGFRPGDVVVKFDGKPVESIKEVGWSKYCIINMTLLRCTTQCLCFFLHLTLNA